VLYQVKPTLVVTNAKPDKEFEQVLLAPGDGLEYNLAFAPTRNFKYASCRAQLVQLELDIFDGLNCNSTVSDSLVFMKLGQQWQNEPMQRTPSHPQAFRDI